VKTPIGGDEGSCGTERSGSTDSLLKVPVLPTFSGDTGLQGLTERLPGGRGRPLPFRQGFLEIEPGL
jgi:hypothetical protein